MLSTTLADQTMPVGDLPGWRQIFTEDFNQNVELGNFPGPEYQDKFTVYPDGTKDTAGQKGGTSVYYPSKVVSVKDSMLRLYLHTENGVQLSAAILPIIPGTHLFGKYTIRFRSESIQGFKTAWLLWPDNGNWPYDGEVDFPEGDLSGGINAYLHPIHAASATDQTTFLSTIPYTDWHTASIEWSSKYIRFILDNKVLGQATNRIPINPMSWILQTEACLPHRYPVITDGTLHIDWMVAYAQDDGTTDE
ncbi:glycoside hydrolase family 16 protein [Tengunoibacter tsumagoiensis]|uniref:GH16 domain-containing protein n=1 Tax=Tengunoibacter tsumagoiensis TaxID=2014871 RepID=A0A402AAV9_9CHLR|nr:glycoside hydrolase family 16 protein [Tengunoibacter tsumagoiensis]GCE16085.1 hypothetical protein KTT_59440 [Tengunoibacter tsumagoiensis]